LATGTQSGSQVIGATAETFHRLRPLARRLQIGHIEQPGRRDGPIFALVNVYPSTYNRPRGQYDWHWIGAMDLKSPRKVSNPLALAVLVLLYERPMHPYEMASTLRERKKEASIKLRYGSLYTVIELLERAGFVQARKTSRQGNRPERTSYQITRAGETEMRQWMREIISTPAKEFPQFEAGLSLLPALPPNEATELLQTRLEFLKHDIQQIKQELAAARAMKLAQLFSIESEFRLARLEAERTFIAQLIPRIEKDGCGFLKEWKKWHSEKASRSDKTPSKPPSNTKE
jgi:DNA-binding PadR family transcriptional regulator